MQKKKKRTDDQMTLIIVPRRNGKPFSFNFAKKHIMAGAALLSVVLIVACTIGALYYRSQAEIRLVKEIKQDSLQKDQTIQLLGQEIKEIEQQQENINRKQNEIKKLMGIQPATEDNPIPSRGNRTIKPTLNSSSNAEEFLELSKNVIGTMRQQEEELNHMLSLVNEKNGYYRSIPNHWPVIGEISSPFGWRKSPFGGRQQSFHDGIDIVNAVGTEVVAAGDGKVIYAGWQAIYGRIVEIDHGYGYVTRYGHNSSLLINKGDTVKKGQAIARLGNTGKSTGPHLHFSILKDGNCQDPNIYLP